MIRVVRPTTAPVKLTQVHQNRMPVFDGLMAGSRVGVRPLTHPVGFTVHQPVGTPLPQKIDGYASARRPLYTAQHRKCCYCERAVEEAHQDVEHFRPKSVYWWLAWTWNNLLFVCKTCNEHKGDSFPLGATRVLQRHSPGLGGESRYLIDPSDPADPDPLDHIEFRVVAGQWIPFPRAGSRRGAVLIQTCRLDRPSLLDGYRHSARQLEDALVRVEAAFKSRNAQHIASAWDDVAARWLSAGAPFVGLVHDVLDQRFPSRRRAPYGLTVNVRPA